MEKELRKLLLTELNLVSYKEGDIDKLTDELMAKAMTANENIKALGYTLRPNDIVMLACSNSCEGMYEDMVQLLPDVKAEPMYPDFPTQVMNMSEAKFRFHQCAHYFSTYGLEALLGVEVRKGWLPDVENTEKTENDTRLLDSRVLELVSEDEICAVALKRILSKRERMTIPETMIVKEAVKNVSADDLKDVKVAFKENIELLFDAAMEMDREDALKVAGAVCQHSGDALKNIYRILKDSKHHLKTSQKRTFVKLLESFSVNDFRGNLMKSKAGRENNLYILMKIDFNAYSRSKEHQEVVNEFRNDNLKSWEGIAKAKLINHDKDALDFVSARPGTMLRMANWILALGYAEDDVCEKLCKCANVLSTQTLVKIINEYNRISENLEDEIETIKRNAEKEEDSILTKYMNLSMENGKSELISKRDSELAKLSKRVHAQHESKLENLKSKTNKRLREWDSKEIESQKNKEITDLERPYYDKIYELKDKYSGQFKDLEKYSSVVFSNLTPLLKVAENKKQYFESMYRSFMARGLKNKAEELRANYVIKDKKTLALEERRDELQKQVENLQKEMEEEISAIMAESDAENSVKRCEIEKKYNEKLAMAETKKAEILLDYNRDKAEINAVDLDAIIANRKEIIADKYNGIIDNIDEVQSNIWERYHAETDKAKEKEEYLLKKANNSPAMKRIFSNVLKSHFELVETKLKGKSVYLDMDEIDTENSQLLGNNKSQEGGYIPSGIAYKIPSEAKRTRFFVYWNDEETVDVDLHAVGIDTLGCGIHVGWNGDYDKYGVTHSGDITHSNAAEYIDIDMSKPVKRLFTNIHLYRGKESLKDIDECYVGMMAVDHINPYVDLYDRANCYFSHEIKMNTKEMFYGYVDVEKRFVKFIGKDKMMTDYEYEENMITLKQYLDILFEGQNVKIVTDKEEADIILSMGKNIHENGVSLVDENFFMEAVQ